MQMKIGQTSGLIWEKLQEKGEVEVSRLPRMLQEKTLIVYQALGWLAREGKIEYRAKSGKTYVSLTDSERKV